MSGEVNDQEFISALQYLVNKGILVIPPVEPIQNNAIETNNDHHSTETPITNQQPVMQNLNSNTLIVSDILQECNRDTICVAYELNSLSTNESEFVVMSVLDGIISTWEGEEFYCHPNAHHLGHFLFEYFDRDVVKALANTDNKCGNGLYHGVLENNKIIQKSIPRYMFNLNIKKSNK